MKKRLSWFSIILSVSLGLPITGQVVFAAEDLPIATVQFPPFSYADEQHRIKGVGSEIINLVLKNLNYQAIISVMPTKRAQSEVSQGTYAGMYMVTHSTERAKYCLFSEPLAKIADVFFKRQSDDIKWQNLSDLNQYIVGATDGYNYANVFKKAVADGKLKIDLIASNSPELQHMKKLTKDRIDLAICERSVCSWLINKNKFDSLDYIKKPIGPVRDFHICLSKKWPNVEKLLTRFNSELSKLKSSGEIKKIYKKYGVVE